MDNLNPTVIKKVENRGTNYEDNDENLMDEIDSREIFDLIRNINDPEHPLTLEELHVLDEKLVSVNNIENIIEVHFMPTIPHCSMATLIGLCIQIQLMRCLPCRFKINVLIYPGTHVSEDAINKQLADKERVAAALENKQLLSVLNQCTLNNSKN